MIPFDSKNRKKVFGQFTGCPCTLTLDTVFFTEDKNLPVKEFNSIVDGRIEQWKNSCEKFIPGPTVEPRISENWNKDAKLLYGKRANFKCIYNEDYAGANYCKHSIQ